MPAFLRHIKPMVAPSACAVDLQPAGRHFRRCGLVAEHQRNTVPLSALTNRLAWNRCRLNQSPIKKKRVCQSHGPLGMSGDDAAIHRLPEAWSAASGDSASAIPPIISMLNRPINHGGWVTDIVPVRYRYLTGAGASGPSGLLYVMVGTTILSKSSDQQETRGAIPSTVVINPSLAGAYCRRRRSAQHCGALVDSPLYRCRKITGS